MPSYDVAYYADFGDVAINILKGLGYSAGPGAQSYWYNEITPTALQLPFYTFVTSFFYWIFGVKSASAHFLMQVLNVLISSVTVIPLMKVFLINKNKKAALIAGLLFCFCPSSIYLTSKLSGTTFVIFFITYIVYLNVLLYSGRLSYRNFLKVGISWGLLLSTSASFAFYSILSFIPLFVREAKNSNLFNILKKIIIAGLVSTVIIAPWSIRNYNTFGKFMPFKSGFWLVMWAGNNTLSENGQGNDITSYIHTGFKNCSDCNEIYPEIEEIYGGIPENKVFDHFKAMTLRHILKNKAKTIKNFFVKFAISLTYSPSHYLHQTLAGKIYSLYAISLLLFFLIGLITSYKGKVPSESFLFYHLIVAIVPVVILYSISYTGQLRFKAQLEPLMLIPVSILFSHSKVTGHKIYKKIEEFFMGTTS